MFHQEKKGPDGDAGNVDATEDNGLQMQLAQFRWTGRGDGINWQWKISGGIVSAGSGRTYHSRVAEVCSNETLHLQQQQCDLCATSCCCTPILHAPEGLQ